MLSLLKKVTIISAKNILLSILEQFAGDFVVADSLMYFPGHGVIFQYCIVNGLMSNCWTELEKEVLYYRQD